MKWEKDICGRCGQPGLVPVNWRELDGVKDCKRCRNRFALVEKHRRKRIELAEKRAAMRSANSAISLKAGGGGTEA